MGGQFVNLDFAEFANIANTLALQSAEVSGDAAVFQVDNTGERLIEERANRGDGESSSFGLVAVSSCHVWKRRCNIYSKSVNHGFKAHVHLSRTDDLGHIL